MGNIVNGNMWLQNHSASNWATNYPLLLNPNGGSVGIGTASPSCKFNVDNGTTTGLNSFIQASGMTAGQGTGFLLGKALSTNNSATLNWNHVGDGLSTNYLGIGAYANDNKLNITAAGNVGIGTASPSSNVAVDTVGIVRGTKGVATNCGSVANLGTGGTVIHTFSPSPGGGHALLTASGPGSQPTPYLFGFVRWVGNLGQASLTVISNSGITATIDVNNTQITLATTSGTLSRVVWNITYLPTPNYLGDYFF
jgi:hypothetical protein